MNEKALGIDWESECKSLTVKLESAKAEIEQLRCRMVDEKEMLEAKLRDADRCIKILQDHQKEDKAEINELAVYKRVYEDIFARR